MRKIEIRPYCGACGRKIRALTLGIRNGEAGIGLSLREQPGLLDIHQAYQETGGEFWLALSGGRVIGTIGLRMEPEHCAILKKFFVDAAHRSQGVGGALYRELLAFARAARVEHILLDTPSVAHAAHRFYERAGFRPIPREALPIPYTYPDRNCILYQLDL